MKAAIVAVTVLMAAAVYAADAPLTAPAPLVVDPIYANAGDPTAVYNHADRTLCVFYTQRRAGSPPTGLPFSWYHGTAIGMASSSDGGQHWFYRGTAQGLDFEPGTNTHWAPEVIWHKGVYHMFVTFLRGIPVTSADGGDVNARSIVHYTSTDLFHWKTMFGATIGLRISVCPCPAMKGALATFVEASAVVYTQMEVVYGQITHHQNLERASIYLVRLRSDCIT